MNEAMIKITDLRKSYGNLDVLKGIDLTIAEREVGNYWTIWQW